MDRVGLDCLSVGILVADHLCAPIDHLPVAGELVMSERLPLHIGGCAANAAMDLAKLDVSVGVIGGVGEDSFGDFIIGTLNRSGVDTRGVRRHAGVETSGTLIINVQGEDRRFIHTAGASAVMRAADIPLDLVQQAKVLYVGGYLLMEALEPERLAEVFRVARAAGVKTVLDVVLPGPGDHWPRLAPLLPETDVFLPNTDEAAILTGLKDPLAQAQHILDTGVKTAVVTCGGEGTILLSENLRLRAGVYPCDYVGATGAGDAFDAGFIAGLVAGADPRECLRWGSALGASCVRSISATESVFTRPEAEAFMAAHSLKIEAF